MNNKVFFELINEKTSKLDFFQGLIILRKLTLERSIETGINQEEIIKSYISYRNKNNKKG